MRKSKKQCTAVLISAIIMSFMILPTIVDAAMYQDSSLRSLVQQYLQQEGVTVRMIPMHRQDGFTHGINIKSMMTQTVTIGFTDTPFDDGLFLLITQDGESIFQAQEDGSVSLIEGQQIDIQYILCMIDAVLAFVDDAKTCDEGNAICYARAILSFVMYVMNCGDSTTTTTIAG